MTAPPAPDFRQHLEVETPEHVVLDYEIAGVGSRALAAIADTAILAVWLLAVGWILGEMTTEGSRWTRVLFGLVSFVSLWGYFTFFEGLRAGQTPGKRWIGIRVVQDTGHPVTVGAAAVRNLLRLADVLPPPYLLGTLLVALHPRAKRIGDLVAGTVVVRDRPLEPAYAVPPPAAPDEESTGVPELSDEEFRVLREFAERSPALLAEVRERLADRIAGRFGERYPDRLGDPPAFLLQLYQDELARRRGRFGGRSRTDAGGRRAGGSVAERMMARKSDRWTAFERLARRAGEQGLDSFEAAELPDYAARYREVAADLARARVYHAPEPVVARLERLVAAGHNTLYRDQRHSVRRAWQFVLRECPAAIIEARRTVLVAFLAFALPALAGYALLREQPGLADDVLPAVMLDRADAGVERRAAGQGYFEADPGDRPLMASRIMTNNIQVAFRCFAGGIFAGVGSLLLLAFNGLSIGLISGHFANRGLLDYLWTFVIGHGVLELFAIWVAGAAGFLLGRALIAPGDLPRGEALVIQGRVAMRMIGAVILLLVIAGLIEGMVSAGTGTLGFRLGVSGASVVLLGLYLGNGWAWRRKATATAT